jgi:hypothetical protein
MVTSRYANDERVTWPDRQWLPPDVLALIPGVGGAGGTVIVDDDAAGGFVVEGALDKDLALRTRSGSLWVFASVDSAIAAVIGPPYE